ncbi:hypothetical protein TNCT_558371 [Trichonephila clavata]|uniref:Uncharacterized protein n=1 Tax=Trichonephila clavata TaxID=2740835 RepID=A0A8X6L4Z4_TRICU|nr:hypothetical protein TNCT_558371 [Trichonephila clavata]
MGRSKTEKLPCSARSISITPAYQNVGETVLDLSMNIWYARKFREKWDSFTKSDVLTSRAEAGLNSPPRFVRKTAKRSQQGTSLNY